MTTIVAVGVMLALTAGRSSPAVDGSGASTSQPATQPFAAGADRPADPTANRRGPARKQALERFGGNPASERAVADGLAWLAAHQDPDGVWRRAGYQRRCPANDLCSCPALTRTDANMDVGVTALAVLAFLGAGHTHQGGPYAQNIERAFEFILARQRPSGSFAPESPMQMYDDAIATLAVAEASVLTNDRVFRLPLERGVRNLERAQQHDGGWDYTADVRTARNDTSITGWVLMALKAAAAANVRPSVETRWRILAHFDRATGPDGRVRYSDKGVGMEEDPQSGQIGPRFGPAMTAVGLYARTAIGLRGDSPDARRQIGLLLGELPSLDAMMHRDATGLHNEYYWYYGTLALFHVGGESWKQWNRALRNSVLEYQEHPTRRDGSRRHSYGSWPAYGPGWGKWGRAGGRVYSTAINTLTLEVYYRYVPAFLAPSGLLGPIELRSRVASLRTAPREALALCRAFHADASEPVLVEFLAHRDAAIRRDAALALAELGSPLGADELRAARPAADAAMRRRIDDALRRIAARPPAGEFGPVTAVDAVAKMLLFATGDASVYYGQRVAVMREGRPIAIARVDRRFTAERAAAATLVSADADVAVGDRVRAESSP
ncbi:MAG: terpene cyclase/mutase family protein [Phycisphaerae bacterium]|nr:terpene cyclase/mutase family protein [Phycisphaerae bacterium]